MSKVINITTDDRSRVTIAKLGAKPGDKFRALLNDDGTITLMPMVTIPKRELLIWEDNDLRENLVRSLTEASLGHAQPDPNLDAALDALEPSLEELTEEE